MFHDDSHDLARNIGAALGPYYEMGLGVKTKIYLVESYSHANNYSQSVDFLLEMLKYHARAFLP